MTKYNLYNSDTKVAEFIIDAGRIREYTPIIPELLPMQIRSCGHEGFLLWLNERAIDLGTLQHRNMVSELWGTRDKLSLVLQTHMFSLSDTFTCFPESEFVPRGNICSPASQDFVSDYILISSDTSLHNLRIPTPNISTDGSFPKTWKYENGVWWLYKIQSTAATRCEVEISKALECCGWDTAQYHYAGTRLTRIKTRCFLGADEFFEPYDSYRYAFADIGDNDSVIFENIASVGEEYAAAWKRILLADALFLNTDRHMRNFGFIRSSKTGKTLRLAPNFDNNQAYLANPGGKYSDRMLRMFMHDADAQTKAELAKLVAACAHSSYLSEAYEAGSRILNAD